jgi:hypothetical protein
MRSAHQSKKKSQKSHGDKTYYKNPKQRRDLIYAKL